MSERNYEFRRRIAVVHRPNRRDQTIKPSPEEVLIEDGWSIVIPTNTPDVVLNVGKDLQDYLFTSMNVSVSLKRSAGLPTLASSGDCCIVLATKRELPELGASLHVSRSYRLVCLPRRVVVVGNEDRGAAQGSYYLEDLMNLREAPILPLGDVTREPLFSPRMTHSGWGLDMFPDDYLNAISHAGMDSILVFMGGRHESGVHVDCTPKGYLDFNDLIDRAARYGLDVYGYSYLRSLRHPDDADAEEYYEGTYGAWFRACPGLKGVILVGESVEFPSKDQHTTGRLRTEPSSDGVPPAKPSPGWWPCYDYPQWLDLLKRVIRRYNPDADIVFWTYNWGWAPEEDRLALIRSLPTDITLLVTFEMFEQLRRENITNVCVDYTLAFEGPGRYFASEAKVAHERGLRLYAMSNTGGLTWDFGVIPYQPAPFQWGRRYAALLQAREKWGLSGLMESHHYGWWPSFVSELAKSAFWRPSVPIEKAAEAIARRDFGSEAAPLVVEAWADWSEASRKYVPTNEDQYGPFRVGPSYPLTLARPVNLPVVWHATSGNRIVIPDYHPRESGRQSLGAARFPVEIRSLERMAKQWQQGIERLERALLATPERKRTTLQEMLNLGRFILRSIVTTIHLKRWWLLKQELLGERDPIKANAILDKMVELAREEIANAKATIPLVEADSRLGWEPTMEYMTDREHLEWKIAVVQRILDREIPDYRKALALTEPPSTAEIQQTG